MAFELGSWNASQTPNYGTTNNQPANTYTYSVGSPASSGPNPGGAVNFTAPTGWTSANNSNWFSNGGDLRYDTSTGNTYRVESPNGYEQVAEVISRGQNGSAGATAAGVANGFSQIAHGWGDMTDTQNVMNQYGNRLAGQYDQYANQALGQMANNYNQINGLLTDDYAKYFNAQQQNLNEIHSKINSGYNDMQSYMPQAQAAYDNAQSNLGTLAPLLADQQNAYYDMGRDMETLRAAYQNVINGTVPEETKAMLEQIYANQMSQATTALNDSYDRSSTNMLDNLGARGILSGTTSAQANTGLAAELLNSIKDAELTYGTEKLKTLIDTPYRQFDAATNLYNSSGQMVSAAGDIVNSGLGIQNAYNQNFGNALGLANQANANYGQLLNGLQQQAANGQLPLNNILQQVGGLGANAGLANTIFGNVSGQMSDYVNNLYQGEIAKLTSAQGQDTGSSSDSWIGPAINAGASIIGSLFG